MRTSLIVIATAVAGLWSAGDAMAQCPGMNPRPRPLSRPASPAYGGPSSPGTGRPSRGAPFPAQPGPVTPAPGSLAPRVANQTTTPFGCAATVDNSSWQVWWRHNRDSLIDMVRATRTRQAVTPDADGRLPLEGERRPGLNDAVVYREIVPVLRRALKEGDARVQHSALMALARVGDGPNHEQEFADELAAQLASGNQGVSEMAVISLGVLGSRPAIRKLSDLLRDSEAGRALVDGERVPVRHRALAAYALGIAGGRLGDQTVSRFLIHSLANVLEQDGERFEDLQAACVHALGLLRLEHTAAPEETQRVSESFEGQIEHLLVLLDDKKSPDMVRVHAPTALARLVAFGDQPQKERVAKALMIRLGDRRESREVQRSLVAALGLIGDCDADELDADIRESLQTAARERDHFTRSFAVMALSEIACRAGEDELEPFAASGEIQEFLTASLTRSSTRLKPWIATALGLIGNRGELDPRSASAIAHLVRKTRSPEEASAYSLAAGLAGIKAVTEHVARNLDKVNDEGFRGDIALGLGLMRTLEGLDALKEIKEETDHRPWLKEQVTIARSMLADQGIVDELLEDLSGCDCIASLQANMTSLAWVGDSRAVASLLGMLRDEGLGDYKSSLVIEALGRIADKDDLPWETVLAHGVNYASAPPTLTAPGTQSGILDL